MYRDSLIKISNYPFVYSITISIIAIFGYSPTSASYQVFLAVGFIATCLTIINPFAELIKKQIIPKAVTKFDANNHSKLKEALQMAEEEEEEKDFVHYEDESEKKKKRIRKKKKIAEGTIDTRAISYEVNKIVSIMYFIIGTGLTTASFGSALITSNTSVFENIIADDNENMQTFLIIFFSSSLTVCSIMTYKCSRMITELKSQMQSALLISYFVAFAKKGDRKIRLLDKVDHYVDQGNWTMVKLYLPKLRYYIIDPTEDGTNN